MAIITGTSGNNVLNSTIRADHINGLGGIDTINGDVGNDRIDGGAGQDLLTGAAGNDLFVFKPGAGFHEIANYKWHTFSKTRGAA